MANDNSEFCFPMTSSSSSPLPPNPQKLRKKRSKLIKMLFPKPQQSSIEKPPHSPLRHCCPECLKPFGSQKALYGHMRCHPDRNYRGMIRKPNYPISTSPSSSNALIQYQSSSSTALMSVEDHEVASSLLLLSRTAVSETGDYNARGAGEASCSSFECSSCKKVFGSYKALGGHRASHKNVKGCFAINRSCDVFDNTSDHDDENKEMLMVNLGHKCGVCLKVFSMGQALGGHKRCHFEKGEDEADDDGNNRRFCGLMDLNFPADHSTASSSAVAANFSLDLTLSL